MNKTDEQIAKLEQELAKLKLIRLQEIEAAKPKPKLFDGPAMAGVRDFFERIERNAQEVNPNANFNILYFGKHSHNAIFLGYYKDCPWELLKDGECLILKVKQPKETFEMFGITWKKHDGSKNKPSELKDSDKIGFITEKEYNREIDFVNMTFTVENIDWNKDILGYYKK